MDILLRWLEENGGSDLLPVRITGNILFFLAKPGRSEELCAKIEVIYMS